MRGRHPHLFLRILFQHASLGLFVEGKLDFLQIVFAGEAAGVEDLVVVWSQLNGVTFLNRADKILAHVLLECVRHWLLEHRHIGDADLV